jgi:hypothetical protein
MNENKNLSDQSQDNEKSLVIFQNFLTTDLIMTPNCLLDIINWLKLGAYVIVHTHQARFFHECTNATLSEDEIREYINTHRFIYINVSKWPGVLDDGEWNWFIKKDGFDECKCSIKSKASNTTATLPYCAKLALNMQNGFIII